MGTLRGGLVGCGFFARNHMQGWTETDDTQIIAVCDADEMRANSFVREFGVGKGYTNAQRASPPTSGVPS